MSNNREEELKRIKEWIEERRKQMEENKSKGDIEAEVLSDSTPEKEAEEEKKKSEAQNKNTNDSTNASSSEQISQKMKSEYPKDFEEWPEDIKKRWAKEYASLKRFSPEDKQANQLKRYMEWFERVPWAREGVSEIDINEVRRILEEEHYGMLGVKQIILELLAVQKLKKERTGLVLLLSGPPGVGKTSVARVIAKAVGKPFRKISMGGMADEVLLKGADRAYMNSFPGAIMRAMCECGSSAPVLLLDEVDKIPRESSRGDCSSILLDILDSNRTSFTDNFLQIPYDLSDVIFICTANDENGIFKPLKDRMEHIRLKGYTYEEKLGIVRKHIVPRKLKESGLAELGYTFSEDAVEMIVDCCITQEGVRELERLVFVSCRRAALLHLEGMMDSRMIDGEFIEQQNILQQFETPAGRRIGFCREEEAEC